MSMWDQQSIEPHIDKYLKLRLEGNDKLIKGDLRGALQNYHIVLLALKVAEMRHPGLEGPLQQIYGLPAPPPVNQVSEVTEEEAEAFERAGEAEKGKAKEPTKPDLVKEAILNTYLNLANVYIKQEKWNKAIDAAEAAKRLHPDHPKAIYREAQGRIGLGEIQKGREMLMKLQKKNPDAAIVAALQKLELDEKSRQTKASAQMRGMFGGIFASKPAADASKGKCTATSENDGKIVELDGNAVGEQPEAVVEATVTPEKTVESADVLEEAEGSSADKAGTTAA